jgi:ABC-type multidrug transport system ATPase subunit
MEELTVDENLEFMARIKGLTDKEFKNNKKCIL